MSLKKFFRAAAVLLITTHFCFSQTVNKNKPVPASSNQAAQTIKFSPAYAEVLLRRTERESELEEFLLDYTDEFPKVKEIKFELGLINREMDKILAINASESGKLTLALGGERLDPAAQIPSVLFDHWTKRNNRNRVEF